MARTIFRGMLDLLQIILYSIFICCLGCSLFCLLVILFTNLLRTGTAKRLLCVILAVSIVNLVANFIKQAMPTLLVSKVIGSVTTSVFTAVLLMGELAIFKKFAQISTLPEFFFRFTFTCMIVIHLVCNLGLYTKLVTVIFGLELNPQAGLFFAAWQQVGETIYYAICVLYEVIQAFYLYACLYRFVGDKKTGLSVISLRNLILLRNCILTIVLLDVLAIGIFVYARFSGLNREFVLTLNGIATALPNVHTILLVVTFNAVYHIALPETSSGSQSTSSLSRLRTNPKSESHIKSMHAPTSVYLD